MATIHRFEDIAAGQKARELAREVYSVSGRGSLSRDYGPREQLRRAAVSVMSNIAEGFEREGDVEFKRFLSIAKGSAGEVRAQLYVALDCGLLDQQTFDRLMLLAMDSSSPIAGLIRYLDRSKQLGHAKWISRTSVKSNV